MKYLFLLISLIVSYPAFAELANELDAAARSSKGTSIMFQAPSNADLLYEEEMKRQAYEEMKARENALKKAEEERLKALKPVNLFGNSLKIYAVVNGEVITSRDMQERANAFVATTQIPITKQNKEMILDRIFQSAIDEKIKLQEAKKNGINISTKELNEGIENFAHANGASIGELKKMLASAEVSEKVFALQIKAEMAWAKLVQRKAAQNLRVTRNDVQKAIDAITRDSKIEKFMVSEIVIPKKKGEHISQLVSILREDPRFELYAMQFSESSTAKNGGHLGWLNKEQLLPPLLNALQKMKDGDISNAIPVGTDYYILKLEKKYTPGVDKMPTPSQEEIRQMLYNKKMEEIAAKYLRDLKNKAIIERKA